jgi:MFS family permease
VTNDKILSSKETKKTEFFYGYVVIIASFLILLIIAGAQYSFGVFFKPVLTEFGWSRAATSGAYSLNMILMGGSGIFAGRLCDRIGPKLVLTAGGLLIGTGYLLMSQVNAIWQIYFFFGVLISAGMGCMAVPLFSVVAKWFTRGRGLASGIVASGMGIGITVLPPLANFLISRYNWRTSYLVLGFAALIIIVTMSQFLKRPLNQSKLIFQDVNAAKTDSPNMRVQGASLSNAIRTRQFWIVNMISLIFLFGVQTVLVHIVAHATDIGISAAAAAVILSVVGFASIVGNVGLGSFGDRFGNRSILVIIFILISLAFFWLIVSSEIWMLYLFAAVYGLGYGGFMTVQSPLVAELFGLKSHGAIFGLIMFATNIGGALGSFFGGFIFDISNSYSWAFIVCALLSAASLILTILLKVYRKQIY